MTSILEDLSAFLIKSPTSWHVVQEMKDRLTSLGFTSLVLQEKWELEKGKKYFFCEEGSLAIFALPKKKPQKMGIVTAHTDSPALKLKPKPLIQKGNMQMLGVEIYGSPILPSWFNRDLAVAGRVVVLSKKGQIEEFLVYFKDSPLSIPLIAPHLDREGYKKGVEIDKQDHLSPLASLADSSATQNYLETLIQKERPYQKLLDFELFLVPIDPPRFLGMKHELFAAYRLDNLASTHTALMAFEKLERIEGSFLPIALFWDHEEIGSDTSTGANSPIFQDLLTRISSLYSLTEEESLILQRKSLCLSVDVSHGLNPNYEKKYDPMHLPLLGKGINLKYTASMRYSTNARTGAVVSSICDKLGLQLQSFVNRTDNLSGSTVGPIFSTKHGIATVDIGIPLLSMHSAREIIACQDHIDMCHLLSYFLQGFDA